ncbi:MAG: PP2C family protein-serine/threonine phosphatase [Bacteriovoracia bacterium]
MKKQQVWVLSKSEKLFEDIKKILTSCVVEHYQTLPSIEDSKSDAHPSVAFIDRSWVLENPAKLKLIRAYYVVLVIDEKKVRTSLPEPMLSGDVDDLLLLPLRNADVISKVRSAQMWKGSKDLLAINATVKDLIENLQEDLRVAREMQKGLIPEKFKQVYGFKVLHKYLCGLKSGGDYLDFFEFEDGNHVGILLSDSTGYGISSSFMSVILRLALKMSREETVSPSKTIQKVFQELLPTMKAHESISIFYGVLNRKTFELKYVTAGNVEFLISNDKITRSLSGNNPALNADLKPTFKEQSLFVHPGERLLFISDGFYSEFKSTKELLESMSEFKEKESLEVINELVFRVRKKLLTDDDMPEQDCSVLILDVEKKALRLAQRG